MFRRAIWWLLSMIVLLLENIATTDNDNTLNDIYLETILRNIDFSMDPCEDFYSFACGNWARNYNSTEDYLDVPGYMDNMVNKQLLKVLQQNSDKNDIHKKLWSYYDSCAKLKNPALNYYLRLVETELNFTWPIFRENWNETWDDEEHFDWLTTIARLRWYGLNGIFITQNINIRPNNSSHYMLEINQPQKGLLLFQKEIAEIFVNFGMTTEESENITTKVMELERRILNLTLSEVKFAEDGKSENYLKIFNELTIQQLFEKIDFIDWQQYFEIILGREVNMTQELVQLFHINFDYFEQLRTTLTQTTNETIAYYIMLKFMYTLNDELPHDAADNSLKCIENLRVNMPLAMNYLYEIHIYKMLRRRNDVVIQQLYGKLRQRFQQLIIVENKLELNATLRDFILDELQSMQLKIGNIPNTTDLAEFVSNYYKQLPTNSSSFYFNHLQLLRFNHLIQLEQLENTTPPSELHFFELDPKNSVSSSPTKIFQNAILLPYGYLQMPLYHSDINPLFQYSLLGFIISHEILHAYDLSHIIYDKAGNYAELGWYVAQQFREHLDCLAQGVNASENISENIADVSGLHLVYHTYFDDVLNSVSDEFVALNTNLTMQQLFLVNSVQFLCGNMAKISKIDMGQINLEHDVHDMRVRQNWAVFSEFSKAFHCREGAAMNSRQYCRLW